MGLAANAIALVLCRILLPGFDLTIPALIVAVVLFAIFSAIFSWIVFRLLRKQAASVVALSGLVSTFLALLLTTLFTPDFTIDGVGTWIIATVVIWLISVLIWVIPGPWREVRRVRQEKG